MFAEFLWTPWLTVFRMPIGSQRCVFRVGKQRIMDFWSGIFARHGLNSDFSYV